MLAIIIAFISKVRKTEENNRIFLIIIISFLVVVVTVVVVALIVVGLANLPVKWYFFQERRKTDKKKVKYNKYKVETVKFLRKKCLTWNCFLIYNKSHCMSPLFCINTINYCKTLRFISV